MLMETTPRPQSMTDFDRELIRKAEALIRYEWRMIDVMIAIADTPEARKRLAYIRFEHQDLCRETN